MSLGAVMPMREAHVRDDMLGRELRGSGHTVREFQPGSFAGAALAGEPMPLVRRLWDARLRGGDGRTLDVYFGLVNDVLVPCAKFAIARESSLWLIIDIYFRTARRPSDNDEYRAGGITRIDTRYVLLGLGATPDLDPETDAVLKTAATICKVREPQNEDEEAAAVNGLCVTNQKRRPLFYSPIGYTT